MSIERLNRTAPNRCFSGGHVGHGRIVSDDARPGLTAYALNLAARVFASRSSSVGRGW